MSMNIKVGGVWKTVSPKVKIGGAWKTVSGGWVRVAGVWRKFHSSEASSYVNHGTTHDTNAGAKSVTTGVTEVGGRLIVITSTSAATIANPVVSDSAGGVWTLVDYSTLATSPPRRVAMFLRTTPTTGAALTVTMTPSGDVTNSGGGLNVIEVRGAPNLALRQVAKYESGGLVIPAVTLPAAANANSFMLAGYSGQGAAGPGTPAGYTIAANASYITPQNFLQSWARLSGETAQTVTWPAQGTAPLMILAEFTP